MAVIQDADLGDKYWTTTEQVRRRMQLEVQNAEPDYEENIIDATDTVQAWWKEATGLDDADFPDPIPDLIQSATAYMAASEAHLDFAQNVSGENQGDERHVFLEQKAHRKFNNWKAHADLSPESKAKEGIGELGAPRGDLADDII